MAALQAEKNYWLHAKEDFINTLIAEELTPLQMAQAEIKLAKLTGTIKHIDAQLNYFFTGRLPLIEAAPLPLNFYINKVITARKRKVSEIVTYKDLKISQQAEKIMLLRSRVSSLKYDLKQAGVRVKNVENDY